MAIATQNATLPENLSVDDSVLHITEDTLSTPRVLMPGKRSLPPERLCFDVSLSVATNGRWIEFLLGTGPCIIPAVRRLLPGHRPVSRVQVHLPIYG